MYWRIGSQYRKHPRDLNKTEFHSIVKKGPPPGLLAFDGDLAVGWCQLTPRSSLLWLERNSRLPRVDELPVWCLSCFYVRKGHRRKGIAAALIEAAIQTARQAGAPALEGYPLDRALTPSASSTGFLSTFLKAGFRIVTRHVPPRPIVRYDIQR
jgi:GNAT superfamily N-acetyltransferase